jgi:hypothetical protein
VDPEEIPGRGRTETAPLWAVDLTATRTFIDGAADRAR